MEIIVPMKELNGEILYSKQYSNIDLDIFKNIINKGVKFHSPFEDKNSYLNSYSYSEKSKEQNYCGVQFHYLQECDYENGKKSRMSEIYIKSMIRNNRRQGLMKEYEMLKDNYDKFCIEVNEMNFNITKPEYKEVIDYLEEQMGKVYRVRLTKLPPGSTIPWHKDETPNEYMRLIIPIITSDECINGFRIDNQYEYEYLPANGGVYWLNGKIDHNVINGSQNPRYVVVLTKPSGTGYFR